MDCGPDKGQHCAEKSREDDPIQHDPELSRVFGERDTQEADYSVDSQIGDRPCGDDPEWGGIASVISPQVDLDTIHTFHIGYQRGLKYKDGLVLAICTMGPRGCGQRYEVPSLSNNARALLPTSNRPDVGSLPADMS